MANMESEISKIDLLHPEILSKEGLIEILRQRQYNVSGLQAVSKEKLIDIFYQYVIPLPQRSYRGNRRGKVMTQKQRVRQLKRKRSESESDSISTKPSQPTHGLVTSFSSLSTESRLKPPPAAINFERKTIKLSSSSTSSKNDSIKINTVIARKKSSDSESSLTSPTPISPSTPKSPRITAPAGISGAKKTIKLINRHLSSDDAKSVKIDGANQKMQNSNGDQDIEMKTEPSISNDSTKDGQVKKKFKREPIKWP